MSVRVLSASVGVAALVLLGSWALGISLARAAFLAPVLVVGAAAIAGLAVFWGRVGLSHYREAKHPRLILGAAAVVVAVFVVLAVLGVDLPRE